ncbi:MAG: HlyD family efflux transporter periplasmic adaptor subunit [Acholeplasmataceae bacterium]|nr:efflux RND transporter periplasmic adaptor subunit [Acidaminococcaceae bacterium]NLY84101.1 HlyD family efflux transporter periplasmic adaptor subunit [Acholeplasmataceae bacterium]
MPKLTTKQSIFLVIGVIVIGLAWFFWRQQTNKVPEGFLVAGGRIEGREVNVSSRVQGRVLKLLADEGNAVKKGQILAVLDSEQIQAQVISAQENLKAAQLQNEQAGYDLDYTRRNSDAAILSAMASAENVQAQLEKAKAVRQIAESNYRRYLKLYRDGAVSAREFDSKKLDYDSSMADVNAVIQLHEAAKANLAAAQSSKIAIEIKQKQFEASQANVEAYRGKLAELLANQKELQVQSPVDGTIITRPVEAGQVVNAVSPLFVIIDLQNIYMKIYIPEQQVGKLRLGSEARIYVDAYRDKYFAGKVTRISDQAQFTPKNVETKEERVKLVFAVEVAVENPDGLLKPGMPGDVILRWKEDLPWMKLN